ncbi:hypothetical protein ACQP2K_25870 [Microbispora siamensis]
MVEPRLTRRLVSLATALAVTASLVTTLAPAASAADITTDLGITSGGDVAAGGGKVFVAGDDRIVVADADGTLSGAITGLSGALGLAITPDGSTVIAAFLGMNEYGAWDGTSLRKVRAYGAEPASGRYSPVVAVSADGTYVAGGRGPESALGVTLFDSATTTPTYTDTCPDHVDLMNLASLTFSGNDLFAVWRNLDNDHHLHLWRLDRATLPGSTLTLTAPSTGTGADVLTMTGQLTLPDGSAPGEQPLVVTRRVNGGAGATRSDVTTGEDGAFTFKDRPGSAGVIRYDVLWDGSSSVRWSAASATVTLAKGASSITLSGPATGIAGTQLSFSGVLALGGHPPVWHSTLTVLRKVTNSKGTVITMLPSVSAALQNGSFRFTDTPAEAGKYSYRVQWAGDQSSLPTTTILDLTVEEAPQG